MHLTIKCVNNMRFYPSKNITSKFGELDPHASGFSLLKFYFKFHKNLFTGLLVKTNLLTLNHGQ